jgi:hypothetical protein
MSIKVHSLQRAGRSRYVILAQGNQLNGEGELVIRNEISGVSSWHRESSQGHAVRHDFWVQLDWLAMVGHSLDTFVQLGSSRAVGVDFDLIGRRNPQIRYSPLDAFLPSG